MKPGEAYKPDPAAAGALKRRALLAALPAAAAASVRPAAAAAQAAWPPRYPSHYAALAAAAAREAKVVVHSTTDASAAAPLIGDFNAAYPAVAVEYRELGSADIHDRFIAQADDAAQRPDVLWSSAMDLQMKLVNDGRAQRYASPEAPHLPSWAIWRDEAYGTTLEPVGFAYDRRRLAPHEVPRTRRDLVRLIDSDVQRFHRRTVTYDLEASGLGFLFATQDARTSGLLWEVARALGRVRAREAATSASMLQSLDAGESVLAYNVLAPYAQARSRGDDAIGFVYPQDYTLVGTRIAFIAGNAAHPNAARLWLDHLLSRRGQAVLAGRSGLFALRADVAAQPAAARPSVDAGARMKPIALGPSLIAYLDRSKRQDFLQRWRRLLAAR